MKLPSTSRIVSFLGGVVALAVVVLPAAGVVHWSTLQLADVTLAGTASVAVIGSFIGHRRLGTPSEPVALAVSIPAAVTAWLVLANAFSWWVLDEASITAIVAAVVVIVGGGTAVAARDAVAPVNPPAK